MASAVVENASAEAISFIVPSPPHANDERRLRRHRRACQRRGMIALARQFDAMGNAEPLERLAGE